MGHIEEPPFTVSASFYGTGVNVDTPVLVELMVAHPNSGRTKRHSVRIELDTSVIERMRDQLFAVLGEGNSRSDSLLLEIVVVGG